MNKCKKLNKPRKHMHKTRNNKSNKAFASKIKRKKKNKLKQASMNKSKNEWKQTKVIEIKQIKQKS